jgi:glycosyltransferase involved in cell wall biosynthesis
MNTSRDKSIQLSVAVITLNEEDRIGKLLESASVADEVVVIDSGSSDNTVAICKAHGARVLHNRWMGYAAQKQLALETARGDWILNLDADEALSEGLTEEMFRAVRETDSSVGGFSMPRLSRYLNRWIRHGGWYPDRKVRLVRKGRGRWIGDGLHEKLEVEGAIKKLEHPIHHYVYRDISDQINTINRFSSVFAEHRGNPGSSAYLVLGLFHALGKFLECAVWKLGFLDGFPGLVIAINSAFYVFLKHAKAWENGLQEDRNQ